MGKFLEGKKWMRACWAREREEAEAQNVPRGAAGRQGRLGPEPRKVSGVAPTGSVRGRGKLERKGRRRG